MAGRALAVHVGLRDEAARHQCLGAFEFGLGEIGIGLCDADRGGKACRLLRLDGAIDDRERLTGADPLAWLDQDADHLPSLADDADRPLAALGPPALRRNVRLPALQPPAQAPYCP